MELTVLMERLEQLGSLQTKRTLLRHGAKEPIFGVKIGDLKKYVLKDIKHQKTMALQLYATGNADAQYLAGLTIDPKNITKEELQLWIKTANCSYIASSIVAGVTAESPFARELALKWMDSSVEYIEKAGWTTYASYLSITDDAVILKDEVASLLEIVASTIHQAKNEVRYAMNQFVICVGSYYVPLLKEATSIATKIGKVEVYLGDTTCKVPLATDAIAKVVTMERVGKKRKHAVC